MAPLDDQVRSLCEGANFGHLATLMPDGSPMSVPVWVGVEGDHVVFFTQTMTRKARNIERDPRVAISIADHEKPYRAGRIRGRVVSTIEGDEALEVIDRISVRYTGQPFPMRMGTVYLVEPDKSGFLELPFEDKPGGEQRG